MWLVHPRVAPFDSGCMLRAPTPLAGVAVEAWVDVVLVPVLEQAQAWPLQPLPARRNSMYQVLIVAPARARDEGLAQCPPRYCTVSCLYPQQQPHTHCVVYPSTQSVASSTRSVSQFNPKTLEAAARLGAILSDLG